MRILEITKRLNKIEQVYNPGFTLLYVKDRREAPANIDTRIIILDEQDRYL